MKKILLIIFLISNILFAQRNAVFSQNSVLGDSITTETTYTLNESVTDSVLLSLLTGYMPIKVDTVSATSNITLATNQGLIPDSNKWYGTTSGDWVLVGSGDTTVNSDSSLTYSNVGAELNPNSYFANWNYVELVTNGDFSIDANWTKQAGWTISEGTANFTATGSYSNLFQNMNEEINNVYLTSLDLTRTTGTLYVKFEGNTYASLNSTGAKLFNLICSTLGNFTLQGDPSFSGTIDNVSVKKLIPPTGWTSATMDASNYVLENVNGIQFKEVTGTTSISLAGLDSGATYQVINNLYSRTSGELNVYNGSTETAFSTSLGLDTVQITMASDTLTLQVDNNSNLVSSMISIKRVYPENYIYLPVTTDEDFLHTLSFNAKSDSANTKTYWSYGSIADSSEVLTATDTLLTINGYGQGADSLKIWATPNSEIAISEPNITKLVDNFKVNKDSTEIIEFTPRTGSLGSYSETITINNKVVNISWDVISTYSLILAENSLATATIDTFYLGNGVISTYTTDSLYLINQTNHYMDLVDIINYGDLGYDFAESRVEADSFMFGSFYYTPSIDDTVNQNIKVIYKPYRAGYSDNSLDTIDLVVKVEVQINANTLLAPQNLLASSNASTGNEITWDDNNIPDTVAYIDYDFNTSGQLAEWTANWSSDISLSSNKLKITDIDNITNAYPSCYIDVDVVSSKTYKISVNMEVGTADEVGLFITDYPYTTTLYNENFSNDTLLSVIIANPSSAQLRIYLQGHISAVNEYVLHDNFTIEQTESSVDSIQIYAQNYYNGVPNSDWYLLNTQIGTDNDYLHTGILDSSLYGYKARFKKETTYSNYSNSDTALFAIPSEPIGENYVTANVESGTYDYVTLVRLTSNLVGAKIFYTTNGSTPTSSSTEYLGRPVDIQSNTTLKAIAIKASVESEVMTKTYTINNKYDVISVSSTTQYIDPKGSSNNVSIWYGEDDFSDRKIYTAIQDYYNTETQPRIKIRFTPTSSGTYYFYGRIGAIAGNQITAQIYNESTSATTTLITEHYVSGDSSKWLGYGIYWDSFGSISLTSGTTYQFIYRVTYAANQAVELLDKLLLTTNGSYTPPEYVVSSPDGGERWTPSTAKNITWEYNGNSSNVKLEYTANSGLTWSSISASTSNDGSYSWTTPADTGDNYRIRITDVDGSNNFTESTNDFSITNTANPYDSTLTFAKSFHVDLNDGMSAGTAQTNGGYQYMTVGRADVDSLVYNWGGYTGINTQIPDLSTMTAFRIDNNDVTDVAAYHNNNSVYEGGEGQMPDLATRTDWQLTDLSNNWYARYSRKGLYCWSKSYQDYMFKKLQVYHDGDVNSYYTDSYSPLIRKNGENLWTYGTATTYFKNKTTGNMFTHKEWVDGKLGYNYEMERRTDSLYGAGIINNGANGLTRESVMAAQPFVDWWWAEGWGGCSGNTQAGETDCPTCAAGSRMSTGDDGVNYWSSNRMQRDIENLLMAQRAGTNMTLLGTGYWYDLQTQETGRMYHFCMMLMGLATPDYKAPFLDYYMGFRSWAGRNIQMKRFVPLGRFEEISNQVFKREFQYATVYINNNTTTAKTVSFSASYTMGSAGTWSESTATSYEIPAQSGLIISTQKTDIE